MTGRKAAAAVSRSGLGLVEDDVLREDRLLGAPRVPVTARRMDAIEFVGDRARARPREVMTGRKAAAAVSRSGLGLVEYDVLREDRP